MVPDSSTEEIRVDGLKFFFFYPQFIRVASPIHIPNKVSLGSCAKTHDQTEQLLSLVFPEPISKAESQSS